jgi:uncharacterized cupin superfamily protein
MQPANVFTATYAYDGTDPDGHRGGEATVGRIAGGSALTVRAYELPPGQGGSPYHYEYAEEWLLILAGTVVLRTPAGERELVTGDLVCFPVGPEGAHEAVNRGAEPARLLMFSSSREPAVAVYPDSDKIGVWPGNDGDSVMLRRADGNVDYWEGER